MHVYKMSSRSLSGSLAIFLSLSNMPIYGAAQTGFSIPSRMGEAQTK